MRSSVISRGSPAGYPACGSIICHTPLAIKPFDRRGLQQHPGRGGRIIGLRIRVFDPTRQAKHQRLARSETAKRLAEIKDDSVFLAHSQSSRELAKAVDRAAIPLP